MLKKLALALLLTGALAAPVFANDLGPATGGNNLGGGGDSLNYLQPANPTLLQPTGGVSTSDDSNGTGLSGLQPESGSKTDIMTLLAQGADNTPQPASAEPGSNLTNDLLLGLAALGFLVTAGIIFRTSKRLEQLQTQPAVLPAGDEAAENSVPSARLARVKKPGKRSKKKQK